MIAAAALAAGCCGSKAGKSPVATSPATQMVTDSGALSAPLVVDALDAAVDPPAGWRRDKNAVDAKHAHFVWVSATGDTAYGVVLMNLPLPIGADIVLWGFLKQMQASDQKADLINREPAPDLPGLRFVAESAKYRIRANLTVHGWRAWAVYAGTMVSRPVNVPELQLAEQARDHTRLLTPASAGSPAH